MELQRDDALMAASRFARELADLRIAVGMLQVERDNAMRLARERDNEIERLREGIREVGFLAGSEVLRSMCEDLLLGSDEVPV